MESINKTSDSTNKIKDSVDKSERIQSTEAIGEIDAIKTTTATDKKISHAAEKIKETSSKINETKTKIVNNRKMQIISKIITALFMIGCIILGVMGYRAGIFTSLEALQDWIAGFGITAPLIFIILQAVQVAIPIIPGGVTLLGGVLIFGPWEGFWYNYIGIVIGSMAVFAISRIYGKPLMYKIFPLELIEKYESWTGNHGRFAKLFAAAIFLPGAPDGLICYLAGTTEMTWKTYTLIILLGKPASIALYSLGFFTVSKGISAIG